MDFDSYFSRKNLLKTPCVGTHYEQKTTPDLLWCVAQVILAVTKENRAKTFTDVEIRSSPLFNALMVEYFSKAPQIEAEGEYNKVSRYQLELFAFAGILEKIGERPSQYRICDLGALEFVSHNDLNSAKFLVAYTKKFIADNGLSPVFEAYKEAPTQENYELIKDAYWKWARVNTAVRGDDRRHTSRVLNKMFNVYCYAYRIPGEDRSVVSAGPCPYSFLIYNRDNFRDADMPTGMTRRQYSQQILSQVDQQGVVATLVAKAKEAVSRRHGKESEIQDPAQGYAPGAGVHIHHIFPQGVYPQYALTKENLIALTPGQHYSFAHVEANTRRINPEFQVVCLQKKLEHICASVIAHDDFYSLREFVRMLNACLGWHLPEDASAEQVRERLAQS